MTSTPKICIYGAGAIGGMIGTELALAGAEVSVVARGQTLKIIRRMAFASSPASRPHRSVKAVAEPAALGIQDYVIIAVKAPPCARSPSASGR
jgi:2-dehydropantoate 2-reductase